MTMTATTHVELPFLFPTASQRKGSIPSVIAHQWSRASHFFFFYNGLCSREAIKRYLEAQTFPRLESIAVAFDIEPMDLVSEKRKKEGVIMTDADRSIIIDAIISSVTT